ncbi:MAG: hypothetical protein HY704_08475 [Gemmatimonadetes bacterium]|nr:hypothetical protein [Gemmatimonadota bacterium]
MTSETALWYRLGYEIESLRQRLASAGHRLDAGSPGLRLAGTVAAAGLSAFTAHLLAGPRSRSSRARPRWIRAAAAGGGAAAITHVLRTLLGNGAERQEGANLLGEVLEGAGDGLLYAAFLEPRVPGPAALRGVAYSLLDYATASQGGLAVVLRSIAPRRGVPVLASLLRGEGVPRAGSIYAHLVFGITLAVLYGSAGARRGISELVDDEGS